MSGCPLLGRGVLNSAYLPYKKAESWGGSFFVTEIWSEPSAHRLVNGRIRKLGSLSTSESCEQL